MEDYISTFIINLENRPERLENVLKEFVGRDEFEINIIKAVKHEIGAAGFFKSIHLAIRNELKNILDDDSGSGSGKGSGSKPGSLPPKRKACEHSARGSRCTYDYMGVEQRECCTSFSASELFCSTLITGINKP
ncbi:MAG: hypothetical protein P0Y49_18590 [Candidatus Pedobacter colombiensis]|uniref:Uncharacterized protein n=1 Tax=Candidatus Pedobacter colombiensis TaxID=3121371 RepID=A0AAJ5W6A5_9SPHI|nr:hypothetical protein [Pedobacter sp.]WEK18787.1 MAG: hypothetical protein P0Y49_18590 [Pedobacter sp.]